uniref:Phycobilisome degradation protein nblA n=1 Tax=Cyanothece sp. (strain PCC 7425 / ATCC 29141) TaxID=395961 RepID=B8HKI1_CYAP4
MIPELDLQLTLEQKFQLQVIESEVATMNREKLIELVIKTSQLLMIKENAIRSLARKVA